MASPKDYAYWQAMLAWRANPSAKLPTPDFDKNKPETGFYRGQRNEAVAIWWTDDQPRQCRAQVNAPARTGIGVTVRNYNQADQIGDSVFAYCCRTPISYEAYTEFVKSGRWPEDVAPAAPTKQDQDPGPVNQAKNGTGTTEERTKAADSPSSLPSSASPETRFATEISDLISGAEAWLDSIGRKITEQAHADRLANYAVAAQAIEDRAEAARVAEKRPLDDEIKAIQARWKPVVEKADKVKRNLKTMLQPWLMEQARKAAQEAVDAQRAAEAARVAGELPPAASEPPTRSVAGTRGRVSLRSRKVYQIDNLREAAEFIAKLNDPPEGFVEGVRSAGELLIKAGVSVPGMSVKTESGVA
jgi:hypothetical protein